MTDSIARPQPEGVTASHAAPPARVSYVAAPEAAAAHFKGELPPLEEPWSGNGLVGVFRKRYLLRLLVQREISGRYQESFLGLIWSYVNPATQFFIYWFVFGVIFQAHDTVPNYAIHLFAGLIIVHFFTETFAAGTRSIVSNRALVVKQAMPREMFPVAAMLVSLYHVMPQVLILAVVCLIAGWTPTVSGIVALFLSISIIAALGTAAALIFSAANVFFRDFYNIVNVFNHFVRYGVTMMYPWSFVVDRLGEDGARIYLLNPLADATLLFQRAFWEGTVSDTGSTATLMPEHLTIHGCVVLAFSIVALILAQRVFARLENAIPERL